MTAHLLVALALAAGATPAETVSAAPPSASAEPAIPPDTTGKTAGAAGVAGASPAPEPGFRAKEDFLEPGRVAFGAAARGGFSTEGIAGGLDLTARLGGFVFGLTAGTAERPGASDGDVGMRTLGVLAGWGHSRRRYRAEVLLAWGAAAWLTRGGGETSRWRGSFGGLQVAFDRVVTGGRGWRVAAGLAAWYRVAGFGGSPGLAAAVIDAGGGLRLRFEIPVR